MDLEKALQSVQKGKLAYHTFPEVAYPLIERFFDIREIDELSEGNLARPTRLAVAVNYNCTFAEMIKIG